MSDFLFYYDLTKKIFDLCTEISLVINTKRIKTTIYHKYSKIQKKNHQRNQINKFYEKYTKNEKNKKNYLRTDI